MPAKKKVPVPTALPIDAPGRRRLPILLRHAWYSLNQTFRRRLAPGGLTPGQFTILRTLSEHEPGGLTQRELTRLIASDPNTVGALVGRMERCGWITRAPDESDHRANRLRLLPAGRSQYGVAREIALALQTEVLEKWSEKERGEFLENLAWIAERCRALADAPAKEPGQNSNSSRR